MNVLQNYCGSTGSIMNVLQNYCGSTAKVQQKYRNASGNASGNASRNMRGFVLNLAISGESLVFGCVENIQIRPQILYGKIQLKKRRKHQKRKINAF